MRSIRFVQALALLSACRAEQPGRGTPATSSSGASVVERDAQPTTAHFNDEAPDARALSQPIDAADASEHTGPDASDARSSATGLADRRANAHVAAVTAEQCRTELPADARCTTVGAMCTGTNVRCVHAPNNAVAPRCSGARWDCWCRGSASAPAWFCRQEVHMAGPLAPPELETA